MTFDFAGAKQRAWIVSGGEWFYDEGVAFPELIAVDGQVPVLALPESIRGDVDRLELAFGWGMAELTEQCRGWVGLCGIVRRRVASLAASGAAALVVALLL